MVFPDVALAHNQLICHLAEDVYTYVNDHNAYLARIKIFTLQYKF